MANPKLATTDYVDDTIAANKITVDTELSKTSENPVQNKVITNAMVGKKDKTSGDGEIFNDYVNNVASGKYSHAEGEHTKASSGRAHAEGVSTTASGFASHAEGSKSNASGNGSHAEGDNSRASGDFSHAEGYSTTASGNYSHTQNFYTVAGYVNQTAMGIFNDNKSDTLLEVGNGTPPASPTSPTVRSNAFEVYLDGHAEVQITGTTDTSLTTKKYVDDAIGNINSILATMFNDVSTQSDEESTDEEVIA